MYHMTYLAQNGSRRPKCLSPSLIAGNDIWYIQSNYAQYFNINDHKHIASISSIDFQTTMQHFTGGWYLTSLGVLWSLYVADL